MIAQKWAIACTREALEDYGYPKRPLELRSHGGDPGQCHGRGEALSDLRCAFSFRNTRTNWRRAPVSPRCRRRCGATSRASCTTGSASAFPRSPKTPCPANWPTASPAALPIVYNFHGPNYRDATPPAPRPWRRSARRWKDWSQNDFDVAVTGGIDRNMGAPTFVKFCKIGALSATGTRPYAEGADGFVMGEGAAIFLMKRLADAERDGDKIYAVLRGMGGVERRQGKGHYGAQPDRPEILPSSAPGRMPDYRPATATLMEGHGTSTRVGDVVEVAEHGRRAQRACICPPARWRWARSNRTSDI